MTTTATPTQTPATVTPARRFVVVEVTDPAADMADAVEVLDDAMTDGFTVYGYAYPLEELDAGQLEALTAALESVHA